VTEAEQPQEPTEPTADDAAQEPVAEEPQAEARAEEPQAEGTQGEETPAEDSQAAEPQAEEAPAAEPQAEAPAGEPQAAEPQAEAPAGAPQAAAAAGDESAEADEEVAPRERPEIPGADLVPDIVPEGTAALGEGEGYETEDGEPAAESGEAEPVEDVQPIADASIDLGAGARYRATGKRKTAVARVSLKPGSGAYSVNGKTLEEFFPRPALQRVIRQPLETVGYEARMDVVAKMHGGGVSAQAGALRHGISRALLEADPNLRGELKRRGFLTRDPRVKERKKAGLKKARKRPQFSKR
jgi:small subunit ribosomal protein S9